MNWWVWWSFPSLTNPVSQGREIYPVCLCKVFLCNPAFLPLLYKPYHHLTFFFSAHVRFSSKDRSPFLSLQEMLLAEGKLKNNMLTKAEMNIHLMRFLIFYLLYRRYGSGRMEFWVQTPFKAVEKWSELKPEIFKENPLLFKNKILLLNVQIKTK